MTGLRVCVVLLAMFCGVSSYADIGVRLEVEHLILHRMETVATFVTVTNRSSEVIVLGSKAGPGRAMLDFDVNLLGVGRAKRKRVSPLDRPVELQPGEGRRLLVELDQAFNMTEVGDYLIEAYVLWEELRYGTKPLNLSIVPGLPLASTTQSVPNNPGVIRNVSLTYLTREQRETLFLSVDEPRSGLSYGVFSLGPLVRVFRPVLEAQGDGRILIVHQSGPRQYMRSIFQSTVGGVRMVDQSYQSIKGHVGVSGDWIEPTAKPTPTPPEDRKPVANR